MTDLNQRIAALSPEKRALLEARLLQKHSAVSEERAPVPVSSRGMELSFAQQSLWFLDRLQPASSFYNIPQAMRIRGAVNAEALRKSFEAIVARHEVLRTQILDLDGKPQPLEVSLRGLASSVEGFEESHPDLVGIVNRICTSLSNLGI